MSLRSRYQERDKWRYREHSANERVLQREPVRVQQIVALYKRDNATSEPRQPKQDAEKEQQRNKGGGPVAGSARAASPAPRTRRRRCRPLGSGRPPPRTSRACCASTCVREKGEALAVSTAKSAARLASTAHQANTESATTGLNCLQRAAITRSRQMTQRQRGERTRAGS